MEREDRLKNESRRDELARLENELRVNPNDKQLAALVRASKFLISQMSWKMRMSKVWSMNSYVNVKTIKGYMVPTIQFFRSIDVL